MVRVRRKSFHPCGSASRGHTSPGGCAEGDSGSEVVTALKASSTTS
jgi:hypothetical protein